MKKLQSEILDKFSTLITSAFGFVAALAWNGAIQAIFRQIFGTPDAIVPMLTYAILVTVIAVVATIYVSRLAEKYKMKEDKAEKS
jgi:hypothetical protein